MKSQHAEEHPLPTFVSRAITNYSDVLLKSGSGIPPLRRVISVQTFPHAESIIRIESTRDGAYAGMRRVSKSEAGPLRNAAALALSSTFEGERDCGQIVLKSDARVVFGASRSNNVGRVLIQLARPSGERIGSVMVLTGRELFGLSRAIEAMDVAAIGAVRR